MSNKNNTKSTYITYSPKINVEEVKKYEPDGMKFLEDNRKEFIKICNRPVSYFMTAYKDNVVKGKHGRHIFIPSKNKDCKVLAVAHLDTVQDPKKGFWWNLKTDKDGCALVQMLTCDDRLGVASILLAFPYLGIDCDVLLTEGEESSRSTAKDFKTDKKYNWLVELDRSGSSCSNGNDVVTYSYGSGSKNTWHKTLEEFGFKSPAHGSYTDIRDLEELGCKGMNVGIGYFNGHGKDAYFRVGEWWRGVMLVKSFYEKNKDVHYPHTYVPYSTSSYSNKYGTYGSDWTKPVTAKYKVGQIIKTSTSSMAKVEVVGLLSGSFLGRKDMWEVVNSEGVLINVVEKASHVKENIKCRNCVQPIEWVLTKMLGRSVCAKCHTILSKYPEEKIEEFFGGGMFCLSEGDTPFYVLEVSEDNVVVMDVTSRNFYTISKREFSKCVTYKFEFDVGDTVVISLAYLDEGIQQSNFIVNARNKDKVDVSLEGTGQIYSLPIHILTTKKEGKPNA